MDGFIDALSPEAEKRITAYNKQVIELIGNIGKASAVTVGGKTPSQTDSAIKDLNAQLLKQDEIIKKLQGDYLKLAENEEKVSRSKKTQTQIILDQAKSYQGLAAQREKALLLATKEEAKLNASQSVYNKVQQKVNLLTKTYNDLAIKRELGIALSSKEEAQLLSLNNRLNKYQTALKTVDATIQKNQRNVGNYAGSFNGLGNSINQITRELPAFTFSAQTGFLALSNNIPILVDEIGRLKDKNKELIAQGQPVKSTFSTILSSILSFQTAMGVGILLFTLYGKEIAEFTGNLFSASKGLDAIKESQTQLNDINVKGQKDAAKEIVSVKSLIEISKDQTLTMQQRLIAVKELQDTYPAYFGNLTKEKILAGETADAEKELTDAILSRAKANAAVEKITENQGKLIDLEVRKLDLAKEQIQAEKDLQREKASSQGSSGGQLTTGVTQNQFNASVRLASIKRELTEIDKEQNALTAVNNTLTTFAIQKEKESILLKLKKADAEKENNREKLTAIELNKENEKSTNALVSKIEEQINLYKKYRDEAATNIDQYREFDKVVKNLSESLELIKDPSKFMSKDVSGLEAQQKAIEKHKKGIEELEKAMAKYRDSFSDTFINNSGFQKTFDILNNNILGFGTNFTVTALAITESFQEMVNFISQFTTENFGKQREELKQETEIALAFAGESQSAQDEIKRQAREKEKEIARREFNAKKQQAKFNIGIDLAQAVMATFARLGFPAGVPLAAIMTAIGLAQIAAVNAQQVPEFYKGTENAPKGWAWTQERGQELILDKNDNVKSYGNNKGAQLTKLDAGDKVKTAEETKRILSSSLIFDNQLNNIMANNGISSPIVVQNNNNGFSPEQMNRLASIVESIPQPIIGIDKNGLKTYTRNGHSQKEILNNQVTFNR